MRNIMTSRLAVLATVLLVLTAVAGCSESGGTAASKAVV
jgi:hypothetical protein